MLKEEITKELERLKNVNNYRKLTVQSKKIINLSSNDYLGLANDEKLKKEFYSNFSPNLSSSSSRLIDGSYSEVMELEEELKKIYGKSAIVFNSGFDANSSLIKTFFNEESLIITDRLNHASIYNGIIESSCNMMRVKHLDYDHLEKVLEKNIDKYQDILVIYESVYSMDGDIIDLDKIIELKRKYRFQLMIDEAHSYGVYGYGIVYEKNYVEEVDFLVIPLGKGGGSVGAYVICEELYKNYIINKSREFIFSTALPPVNNCWNLFILKKMPYFQEKRGKLQEIVRYTLEKLQENEIETTSTTHIISIIIGDNKKAIEIAQNLKNKGINIYPVKEPTVPKGTARFRIGLNPNFEKKEIDYFIKELKYEIDSFL